MNSHQPEASTSTQMPVTKHYCSLVIDPGLPREQYLKLIEAEGVVHSLVQRLLEKHGGDKHLLFDAQVIPSIKPGSKTRPSNTSNQGFRQSSAFLASLPSLSKALVAGGDASLTWPGFNDSSNPGRGEMPWETSKYKHRRRETCLLNGIVEGVETLSHRPQRECARRFIHTVTPPEAIPLLNKSFRTKTLDSHYLIILTGSSSTDSTGEEWRAQPTTNMDQEWDEKSWREVGEGCMAKGIYASCVVAGREEDSELSRSLRILCQETSPNGFEEAWFDVPEDADVAISGFGIDPGTVPPSPSAPATSSAPTEQIITPATNPSEQLPNMTNNNNNAAKMQYVQSQMTAFRTIQNRAAESGNPLNAQMVTQLMQAMKSGNLDMNAPGMQQIKSLLSLQQQQKSGQATNPGAAAAMQAQAQGSGIGGQGSGNGTDQLLMAAMRQQMLQQGQGQGQGQVNNGQQSQQSQHVQQNQQQQQRPQVQSQPQQAQQQNQRPNQPGNQLWSGNLIWNINCTSRLALTLSAGAVGGSQSSDYKSELWPKDLTISNVTSCTLQDLQTYARANRAPFAILLPQAPAGDTSNHQRYTNMAKSLHAGGQMATVNFGNDRGLIVFGMLTNGETRPERLMALVCVNSPLPPIRNQQQPAGDVNMGNHQRTQSSQSQTQSQSNPQQQIQTQIFQQNGLAQPPAQINSISPSFNNNGNQAQLQQNQQMFQQQQQQQYNQQARPPGQQQYMLTPEQTQIFRHLAAQHNLPLENNFDPFNLDEGKYRQIMGLVNSASNKMAQARPQSTQQGQTQPGMQGQSQVGQGMGMDSQLDMMNYQQQQQQQFGGQQGQGGFQGMNMGGQYQ